MTGLCCLALVAAGTAAAADEVFTGRQAWEIARKSTCGTLATGVTRYGVWRSQDAGESWSIVLANPQYLATKPSSNGSAVGCTDLAIRADVPHPLDPGPLAR